MQAVGRAVNTISHGVEQGIFRTCSEAKSYLENALSITVSAETIRRISHSKKLKCYVKIKKPRLTTIHMKNRYEFARVHKERQN